MSVLPRGWSEVPLASLLEDGPTNGYSPKAESGATGTLTLRLSATTTGRLVLDEKTTKRISERIDTTSKFWLRPGDMLVQRANTLEYVGTAAMFAGPADTYIYPDLMMRLRVDRRVVAPEYLVQFVNAVGKRGYLRDRATGTAGNMPKINGTVLREMPVKVPPLAEQRRIVAKLEDLLARSRRAKEALDAVPPLLDKLRQSILAAAFRGDLTADWRAKNPDVEPAEKLLARIRVERRKKWEEAELAKMRAKGKMASVDGTRYRAPEPPEMEELPEIPEGWCWTTVGELVASMEAGASFKCDERLPDDDEVGVLKVSAVTWGEYDEGESKTCTDASRIDPSLFVRPGDFLFSRANTIELVGACVIARRVSKRLMLSDKILRFEVLGGLDEWLLTCLRSPFGRHEIERLSTGNQLSMRNIGQERIRQLRIPLPPRAEIEALQAAVAAGMRGARALAGSLEMSNRRVDELGRAILAKAFRGELVPQDPTDEPAAEMLARLRAADAPSTDRPSGVRTKRKKGRAA